MSIVRFALGSAPPTLPTHAPSHPADQPPRRARRRHPPSPGLRSHADEDAKEAPRSIPRGRPRTPGRASRLSAAASSTVSSSIRRRRTSVYARTDIGGAYRRNPATQRWEPLLDWVPYADLNLMGVESIAVDPADPDKVYLACGTYTAPDVPDGAILRSTDGGRTFAAHERPHQVRRQRSGARQRRTAGGRPQRWPRAVSRHAPQRALEEHRRRHHLDARGQPSPPTS